MKASRNSLIFLIDFLENVAEPLLTAGKTEENSLPYAEVSYLLGNMKTLLHGLPPKDFFTKWRMLGDFSQERKAIPYSVSRSCCLVS